MQYVSVGFGKIKKLQAFMSKDDHPPVEEDAAARLLQSTWRAGVARRKMQGRRRRVNEARSLLASVHEGEFEARIEFARRVAFSSLFRDAVAVVGTGSAFITTEIARRLMRPSTCARTLIMISQSTTPDDLHGAIRCSDNQDSGAALEFSVSEAELKASAAEKRAACRAIFHRVDTDMSGFIDAEELVELLETLTEELDVGSELPEITVEEAAFFIESMDADGNEVIDEKEFCDFMVHGMSTTPAARERFKARSSLHHKLMQVIDGLSEVTERRSAALQRLYERYEDKEKGGLTTETLFQLFSEAQTDVVHRWDDVQQFFLVMDGDRNGCISRDEWCSYLLYGMSMTTEWRASFADRSPMHQKIAGIVEICLARSRAAGTPRRQSRASGSTVVRRPLED